MQMFRPRSWRVRSDAAEARTRKEESLHDLHRIRAAIAHGEEIPRDAVDSLETRERTLKVARGEPVPPIEAPEESDAAVEEAKRPGGRPRRS